MRYSLLVCTCMGLGVWVFQPPFHSSYLPHSLQGAAGSVVRSTSRSIGSGVTSYTYPTLETVTDSTRPITQMSITEKMNAHIVHFTGAVMSDTFVLSHFSRAFVPDQYSDFLRPGKYPNGNSILPNSIASSLDGIAIPRKTRLLVYSSHNLTGSLLIDITGPAIVNNGIWESSDFYAVANKKNFSTELQEIFPQKQRSYYGGSGSDMSNWPHFSFEIQEVNE